MKMVEGVYVLSQKDLRDIHKKVHLAAVSAHFGCTMMAHFSKYTGCVLTGMAEDLEYMSLVQELDMQPIYLEKSIYLIDYPKSYWFVSNHPNLNHVDLESVRKFHGSLVRGG